MNQQDERLPPHNRDAERSLLSSMLRDKNVIPEAVNLVKAEQFYIFGHQKIYEAITKLSDDGKAADIVTVAEYLIQDKRIDDVGGVPYLAELWDAAPSAAHYRQYAEIICHAWSRRELSYADRENEKDIYDLSIPALEAIKRGKKWITSSAAVVRFFASLPSSLPAPTASPIRTPTKRQSDCDRAKKNLADRYRI